MDITRKTENGLRWYSDGDNSVLSVTTVLGFLQEDTTGLEKWKSRNDGTDGNPHHEHIYWYSAPRGTLCHYQALQHFEDAFDVSENMWGEEEADSMTQVSDGPSEGTFDTASHDLDDITYSILANKGVVDSREQYEAMFADTELADICRRDVDYFTEQFLDICDELGVDTESVITVERYLVNGEDGYGGQCDMLYEDPEGNVVVADLKTSSALRQKHRLQSVAYMKAVEKADNGPDKVDRIEVWRICPEEDSWQVHSHTVPNHVEHLYDEQNVEDAAYTDAHWYDDKWGEFEYGSIEDMWDTFKDITKTAYDSRGNQQADGRHSTTSDGSGE